MIRKRTNLKVPRYFLLTYFEKLAYEKNLIYDWIQVWENWNTLKLCLQNDNTVDSHNSKKIYVVTLVSSVKMNWNGLSTSYS